MGAEAVAGGMGLGPSGPSSAYASGVLWGPGPEAGRSLSSDGGGPEGAGMGGERTKL